ncbi:hypothetical protein CFP56_005414 [Quercus suber]|uniref:Uncharacterized protein n=1 Tax=Quercus suber TaxID=58331 RepID=A0AAW0LBC1_QUESU
MAESLKMAHSHYAKMAKLFSSWSGDVETMVASMNKTFKTLDWHQPDDTKFYNAIRVALSRRTQISYVESNLRTHQNEESDAVSSIQARLKEAGPADHENTKYI